MRDGAHTPGNKQCKPILVKSAKLIPLLMLAEVEEERDDEDEAEYGVVCEVGYGVGYGVGYEAGCERDDDNAAIDGVGAEVL